MAKIRPVTLTSLMLCYQIIFMHTSALDITLFSPKTSIKAAIGEELHITCLASKCSNKDPGFTWSPVTDNYLGGNVVTVDQKSTLSMEVRAETDGTYRCTVSCDNAPAEKSFTITVYSFPSDPVLHVSSLAVGQPSRITCVFPNVYPAEWLTAQILMNDIPVATYEPEENENEILNISLTHDVLLAEEMDESTILCSARLEFPDSDAEPLQRHKTQKLHLMYPPVKPQIIVQPSTMVKAGEEIRLLCSSDSKSHVIQLVKQIGDVEYEMSADDQGSLILSNAEPENSGVYICYAQNSVGKTFSQVEINVRGPPENPMLSLTPRTTVSAGEAVTIECIARSDANVTLWKISEDGEMFFLDSAGKVVIDEADPIDAAVYKCTAENQYGVSEASESLTVEYPPRETILSSSPIDVNEGDMVVLTCISQGVPTPTISISKLLPTGESVLLSEDSVIALAKVTGGIYQCQATNRLGSEKHKLELNVRAAPQNTQISITPSSVVREGDNVHIRCTSEASPAPRLALKMKMEHDVVDLVAEDGEYIISSAEERHIGIYICESTNVVGTEIVEAVLNVQVPPKNTYITISPSEVVREGDIVQIWCSSEGSPDPKLVLKMKTEDELLSLESSDGFYNISHAEIENAGTYICESTNVLGLEVALNTLTVQIPPRNTTVVVTPSQNIIEGDTVTITCETHSIPSPTIILQKICDQNNTVLQTQNGTFTLHNVTRNDTGTYKIKIFNSAGNETEVINIVVAERQQDPRFNPMSTIIFGSVAFVSVGVIGSIIYHLKKAKLQGSYSLVEALRSKV